MLPITPDNDEMERQWIPYPTNSTLFGPKRRVNLLEQPDPGLRVGTSLNQRSTSGCPEASCRARTVSVAAAGCRRGALHTTCHPITPTEMAKSQT
jgi:hypothetical protein